MYVKKLIFELVIFLCVIVTAIQASSESEQGNGSIKDTVLDSKLIKENIGIQTDATEVSDIVFRQSGICSTDADCHHLGTCESKDGGKFCNCKKGTSGDFCKTVDECVDNPVRCGTGDDVACIFDIVEEKATCKCDNESKTYVVDEERCMSPCGKHYDCQPNGYCYHVIGGSKFCACSLGTSGDFCEIIDQCHSKEVDCGVDPDATCTLGRKGNVYCECRDTKQGFDYYEKVCKDCECGERSLGCIYQNGTRTCSCQRQYYSKEGKYCKCGQHFWECKFEGKTKICDCFRGYKQNGDQCQSCDCGKASTNCDFKGGKKLCTCKEGYVPGPDAYCREMCTFTRPCQNGGKCIQNSCKCLEGTSGDLCQNVDDCINKCGSKWNIDPNADCLYNVSSQKAYCKCKGDELIFDEYDKRCKECYCGSYALSCKFEKGDKKCICQSLYADLFGICAPCDCGRNGKCSFSYSWKSCDCDAGYRDYLGTCKECNCGKNGYCSFEGGAKVCNCQSGYKESQGTCKACYCGDNGECEFNAFGDKVCTCRNGYNMNTGMCAVCNCGTGNNCTFNADGTKRCVCPQGYADDSGYCKACDCGPIEANCSFDFLFHRCYCPKGYEESERQFSILGKYCKDIDECVKRPSVCPYAGTDCLNKPGSYDCVCRKGYERLPGKNPNPYGCRDIDECINGRNPCATDAECVNTVGSFRCKCIHGYRILSSSYPERNKCRGASRPWRTASIVIGCLFGLTISGLLIAVIRKCGK